MVDVLDFCACVLLLLPAGDLEECGARPPRHAPVAFRPPAPPPPPRPPAVVMEFPHGARAASWLGLDLCCHVFNTPNAFAQSEKLGAAVRQLLAANRGSVLSPPTSWQRSVCCQNPVCDVLADYLPLGCSCHTHELKVRVRTAGSAAPLFVPSSA